METVAIAKNHDRIVGVYYNTTIAEDELARSETGGKGGYTTYVFVYRIGQAEADEIYRFDRGTKTLQRHFED